MLYLRRVPCAQLIDANTGEILENFGWFETATQARSACGKHAERLLVWERSPDNLWVAEEEDEVYQVEADPFEGSATAQAAWGMRCT